MPNEYSWMMIRGAVMVAASAIVVSACGGSVEFTAGVGGAAGSAAAGAPSAGTSNGGASGAAAGGAAAGGAGGCVNVACVQDRACAPGEKTALDASGCCTICVPDGGGSGGGGNMCEHVACPAIACGPGSKWTSVPGQCCGTCVSDPDACNEAASQYQELRTQLLGAPGALSCATNADCQFLATNASCGDSCVSYSVNTEAAASIEQRLSDFAAINCSFCAVTQPPCFAPPPPFCASGRCILGGYL